MRALTDPGGPAGLDAWDVRNENQIRFLGRLGRDEKPYIDGAALAANGEALVVAASSAFGGDSDVFMVDIASGATVARAGAAGGNVQHLAISSDARNVAYLTTSGTLRFWQPGMRDPSRVIASSLGRDGTLALADGDQRLVSAADEVCVWEFPGGRLLHRLAGHPGTWSIALLAPREALTAAKDWIVSLWDLEAGTEIASLGLDDEAREISLDRDEGTLVMGDGRGDVYTFELVRGAAARAGNL